MSQVTPLPPVLITPALPTVVGQANAPVLPGIAPVDVYLGPTGGGKGPAPEDAVEPQALHRALGIDPSKYTGSPLKVTRAYRRVLESGVTNQKDLRVADRLAMEESPDDSGKLATETRRIPHEIQIVDVETLADIHVFGAMHPSMARFADPRRGMAEKIALFTARLSEEISREEMARLLGSDGGERFRVKRTRVGASVLTIDHERTHATPPGRRHPVYEVNYMDIPEKGTLDEIYRAIHFNLTQDEVPAMMVMMRRSEIHRLLTGDDILKMKAQGPYVKMLPALKRALVSEGKEGMRKAIADSPGYLQYKLAAFQIAVMWKFGTRDFPDIGKLLDEMGVMQDGNRIAINPSKSRTFYNEKFIPLLAGRGINMVFRSMSLGRRDREKLNRLKCFFASGARFRSMDDFLKDEFDEIVPILGMVMGDPIPQSMDEPVAEFEAMPVLSQPKRIGTTLVLPSTDEAALSEMEIAGRFAELLWNTHRDSPMVVSEHPAPYMIYAERSDPQTSARIYSLLTHLARERKLSVSDTWSLAYSLRRFGYEEEGTRLVGLAMRRFAEKDWEIFDVADPMLPVRAGRMDELIAFLDLERERLDSDFAEGEETGDEVSEEILDLIDFAAEGGFPAGGGALDPRLFSSMAGRPSKRPGLFADHIRDVLRHVHDHGTNLPAKTIRYLEKGLEAVFDMGLKKGMAKLDEYRGEIAPGEACLKDQFVEDVVASFLMSKHDLVEGGRTPETVFQGFDVEELGCDVSELFANNYCGAVFGDEHSYHNLYSFSGRWSDEYAALVSACLSTAPFYNLGLKLLRRIPDSLVKVSVYELAAENFPKGGADSERLALFEEYRSLFLKCESPLRKWAWDEKDAGTADSMWHAMKNPAKADFRETHFFAHHSFTQAKLLMGGKKSPLQKKGLQLLREAPAGNKTVANPHICKAGTRRGYIAESKTYKPLLERALEIIRIAPSIPLSHREEILREACDHLMKEDADGLDSPPLTDIFLELATRLGVCGYSDILDDLVAYWDRVIIPAQEASIEKIKKEKSRAAEKGFFASLQTGASLLMPVYMAVARGSAEDLTAQIERVKDDNGRRRFDSVLIQNALHYISQTEVLERVSLSDEDVASLAREAVDRYIAEIGGEWNSFKFMAFVDVLKGLKVSDETLDGIFEYFIDRLTVRQIPLLTRGRDAGPAEIVDLFKGVSFLMEGRRTPRASAKLLNLMRDANRDIHANPKGDDATGVIEASRRLFEILPGQITADPDKRKSLLDSQSGDRITAADRALNRYRNGLPPANKSDEGFDIRSLIGAVESAVQKETWDMPGGAALEVKRAIEAEVLLAMDRLQISGEASSLAMAAVSSGIARSHTFVPRSEYEGGLIHHVYTVWQRAVMSGNHQIAAALFNLWGETDERVGIRGRMALYLDALGHPQTPLETRRAIFSKIALGPAVSSYVKRSWEDAVEDGDTRREKLIYELARPQVAFESYDQEPRYRLPSDVIYAMATEGSPSIASRIIAEQRAFAGNPEKYICRPDDEASLLVFANNTPHLKFMGLIWTNMSPQDYKEDGEFVIRLSRIADATLLKKKKPRAANFRGSNRALERLIEGAGEEIRPQFAEYKALVRHDPAEKNPSISHGDEYRNSWNIANGLSSSIGDLKDTKKMFEAMNNALLFYRRALDRLPAANFEMTRHLGGRSPQTQLVATRLFAGLPLGKRHTLLKDMDGADRAGANRIFLQGTGQAKAGQILSYWPDVPVEERRDLAHFQADAPKSDRIEFVDTIRRELKDADLRIVDHIIANLSAEPIGVGTVADVYESSLPDGTKIAVKAITPSKEAEFKNGVSLINGLRKSLVLYLGELPGIDQMIEVIDMYLGIVDEELDLTNEARHAKMLGDTAKDGITIPYYMPKFARAKVVITELVEGERYDTKNPAHVELARALLYPFAMRQILAMGLFPLDMQPGNLLVTGAGTMIGLLDHGQAIFLNEEDRALLGRILDGVRDKDAKALAQSLESAGKGGENYKPQDLRNSLREFLSDDLALSRGDPVTRLFAICRESGLVLDLKYRKLGKGLATLTAATTLEANADGEAPSRGYDENERVKVAEAILKNDTGAAAKIMEGVMERIGEHRIAIGWRNARRWLNEFIADVKATVGEGNIQILQKILVESARKKGLVINAEGIMSGKYLAKDSK